MDNFNNNPTKKIEYRVVPVTRFQVTRYQEFEGSASTVEGRGEYPNAEMAHEVGYALCKQEHNLIGWSPDDERIQYPHGLGAYPADAMLKTV